MQCNKIRLGINENMTVDEISDKIHSIQAELEEFRKTSNARFTTRYRCLQKQRLDCLSQIQREPEMRKEVHVDRHPPVHHATKRRRVPGIDLLPLSIASYTTDRQGKSPSVSPVEKNQLDLCVRCQVNMKVCNKKGIMVCDKCGYCESYMDVTVNALPYKSNVEMSSFSYKRINHFNEWLLQIQGKEGTEVPLYVIEEVKVALLRERITDMKSVTTLKIRDILKQLKRSKMYYHITQILCVVTGEDAPELSPEIEEKCRLMFIAIQTPFLQHCPMSRKNFLSYPYCLFKFLELLGCNQVLDSFILLKGRDKLAKQDDIFKLICNTLNWEFIPSV